MRCTPLDVRWKAQHSTQLWPPLGAPHTFTAEARDRMRATMLISEMDHVAERGTTEAIFAAEPSHGQGQCYGSDPHTTDGAGKHPLLCLIYFQAPPPPRDYKGLCVPHVRLAQFSSLALLLGSLA